MMITNLTIKVLLLLVAAITKLAIKFLLLLVATLATTYATVAFLAGLDDDFQCSALLAVLCLGGVFAIDYHADARRRAREAAWARDREGLQ